MIDSPQSLPSDLFYRKHKPMVFHGLYGAVYGNSMSAKKSRYSETASLKDDCDATMSKVNILLVTNYVTQG